MKPGIKGSADSMGGHIRLYWVILDSPAWRALTPADQRAYVALRRGLRSTNNGDLSLPLSVAKHHGIASQTTLAKSLRALCAVGLLAVTREGGCKRNGQRLPTLYRFTDQECYAVPAKHIEPAKATKEWEAFKSIAHARALIAKAEADARQKWAAEQAERAAAKTKTAVQKLDATDPEIGANAPKTSPESGCGSHGPVQKADLAERAANAAPVRLSA